MNGIARRDASDQRQRSWWLLLSLPIGVLGLIGAAVGALVDGAYSGMTHEWANQTLGQDVADLAVGFPLLLVLAAMAARGSSRALIGWLGVIIATLYTYVIFTLDVPFGHLYLLNVAILGMTGAAFLGCLTAVRPDLVRQRFDARAPTRSTGWSLIAVAVLFFGLWLVEDLPATINGVASPALQEVGLFSNPVHVLDMAFLLPACIAAGVALVQRRAWAYVLAPALTAALATISAGIVAIMAIAMLDGEDGLLAIATVMTIVGLGQAAMTVRFLRHLRPIEASR